MYYDDDDKVELLRDVFGAREVRVDPEGIHVDGTFFPVVDDVIVVLDADRLPPAVRSRVAEHRRRPGAAAPFAADIQRTFGEEWKAHPQVRPEHKLELEAYFDLLSMDDLKGQRVADLGCGMGRWSYFLAQHCREVVLVDYSESIFVARRNLRHADNAIFVMADVLDLPFRDDAFDFVLCVGVLHHLPTDARAAVRDLRRLAPRHLVYLYYALDNRPAYFRWLLAVVTAVRMLLSRLKSPRARVAVSWLLAVVIYAPIAQLGRVLLPLGVDRFVPMVDSYAGKSVSRLRQEAYDRFFTRIEQRFTRQQIEALADSSGLLRVSDHHPYWHFLWERAGDGER